MMEERIFYDSKDKFENYLHIYRYSKANTYLKKDGRVLDIGCGNGFGSNILSKVTKSVIAIDIDKKAIDFSKKNQNKTIQFIQASATKLPFNDKFFDNVVSIENIEHVQDFQSYLSEAFRVLKKNGILFLTTPNLDRPQNIFLHWSGYNVPKNKFHYREFSPMFLENELKKTGFKVETTKGFVLHLFPRRYSFVRWITDWQWVTKLIINFSFMPVNCYFYVVARKP